MTHPVLHVSPPPVLCLFTTACVYWPVDCPRLPSLVSRAPVSSCLVFVVVGFLSLPCPFLLPPPCFGASLPLLLRLLLLLCVFRFFRFCVSTPNQHSQPIPAHEHCVLHACNQPTPRCMPCRYICIHIARCDVACCPACRRTAQHSTQSTCYRAGPPLPPAAAAEPAAGILGAAACRVRPPLDKGEGEGRPCAGPRLGDWWVGACAWRWAPERRWTTVAEEEAAGHI